MLLYPSPGYTEQVTREPGMGAIPPSGWVCSGSCHLVVNTLWFYHTLWPPQRGSSGLLKGKRGWFLAGGGVTVQMDNILLLVDNLKKKLSQKMIIFY